MINACRIWAFALMVRSVKKPRRPAYWLGIGGLFALASLYKQIAAVTAVFLVGAHILYGRSKRQALREGGLIAGVGAAAWVYVFAYFLLLKRLGDFVGAVFLYNMGYAGDQGINVSKGLGLSLLAPEHLLFV